MTLLDEILGATPPEAYALLARAGRDDLEVLAGPIVDVALLADIPLTDAAGIRREVLSIVPFRQVAERGYRAHDDGAPLRCMIVEQRESVPRNEAIRILPTGEIDVTAVGFDIPDEEYADIVQHVIDDEIGRGEGADFVIRRDFIATTGTPARSLAPNLLRRLLERESGAHWTFAIVTPDIALVGASPERHVSVERGVVTMNPISGTYRHPSTGPDREGFLEFLGDTKEVEELFMVVDEELKMMSAVCASGGFIHGPYLKQMSRLTHTEYLLRGHSDFDVRDVLRETMFAPTVTGSPMENACAVIERHETAGRGYYAGVAALISPEDGGGFSLDAPILIRTAQLAGDGTVRVAAGATLVRHSVPASEVKETHSKASGVLAALGLLPAVDVARHAPLADDPVIQDALQRRNAQLSPFWMNDQQPEPEAGFAGRRATIVDFEDRFTTMLGHQLRHLGMEVRIVHWSTLEDADIENADLLVCGPGPGDPLDLGSARVRKIGEVIDARRAVGLPLLAVCLSHQVLATKLGLGIDRLDRPRQGLPLEIDLFGTPAVVGFYNTFTARLAPGGSLPDRVEGSVDPASRDVFALRGPGFASVQGHLESILSRDGIAALQVLAASAMAVAA
ncbi:chorismate-binding protein [Glaciihabitans sp. UYNi722]|uniref:chorismate-binding protein n=1 Tax=Glaciihabitans sp. UYNi722 TaxID=3156344 RepID=UPI003399F941